jgi:hypothetical protein
LAFTSAASISGTAKEGSVLTAVNGALNDSDASVTGYQWQSSTDGLSGWTDIGGATSSTYTPLEGDETKFLRVVETASDSDGGPSTTSTSAAVSDITLAFTSVASISGTAKEGSRLTAVNGALNDGDASVTGYQWQSSTDGLSGWTDIGGATSSTYTPVEGDETQFLRVIETASDSDGGPDVTSTSAATAAVADITLAFTTAASISGTAKEGSVLTAVNGALNDGDASVTGYQWQSSTEPGLSGWSNIGGATSSTYTPVEGDETRFLRVIETASDSDGGSITFSTSAASAAVSDITLAFTSAASISGTAQEGTVLTAVNGTLNDSDASVTGYQWQSSTDGLSGWTDIGGATSSTYTPVEGDETRFLRVIETASDSDGAPSTTSTSAASAAVSDITLAFTSAASISGTAKEGSVLTAVNGTLNDSDASVTGYQWQSSTDGLSGWADIGGATSSTYTPVEGDETRFLRVVETASDSDGGPSTTSTSAATTVVSDITLAFTSAASISGTAKEGSVLTAVNGALNDSDASVTGYQWQSSTDGLSGWADIGGATSSTYTPVEGDETQFLRVVETASDHDGGSITFSTSAASAAVSDITLAFTSAASISGTAKEGSVLTAVNGAVNDSDASVTGYQWQSSTDGLSGWTNIGGATSSTYTPVEGDETKFLRVVETASDSDGGPSTTSTSVASTAVSDITLAFTSAASISGTAKEGSVLTAVNGALNDSDASVTGYQWQSSTDGLSGWTDIGGATSSTYTPVEGDETRFLRVVKTASDSDGGPSTTSTSTATSAVTDNSSLAVSLDSVTANAGQTLNATAVIGDADDTGATVHYQWQTSMDDFATYSVVGSDSASYVVQPSDQGAAVRVHASFTDDTNVLVSQNSTAANSFTLPGQHEVIIVHGGVQMGPTYSSIQDAIDAAVSGDRIFVGSGIYNENVTVNKDGLSIIGAGDSTIIHGTFKSDNSIADGGVATFLESGASYSQTAGRGVEVAANNVAIRNLKIDSFTYGVDLSNGTSGTSLTNVDITDSLVGIKKGTAASITNLNITNGSISDGLIGIDFDKTTTVGQQAVGTAVGVTIDGTDFSNLVYKGIYVEALSDAHLTNIDMSNVGQFGAPSTSGTQGTGGDGIDLNLKNGTYSNIEIDNFHLTNTGESDQNDAINHPIGDKNGGAVVVEARDFGSYLNVPGIITDTVSIHDGIIDGSTSTGIQVGEPNQGNLDGPAVNISNVSISGAEHNGGPSPATGRGDIANVTAATTTMTLANGGQTVSTSPTSTGNIVFNSSTGNDSITGHGELDTVHYGQTLSAASFSYNSGQNQWTVSAGAGGTDHLTGVEKVTDGSGHNFLLVDPAGSYTTIQAAINAASDGDTILVASGTYSGFVDVTKAVTIEGVDNVGIPGTSQARGAESVLTGGVRVSVDGVTIDGVTIAGTYDSQGLDGTDFNNGLLIKTNNVTIQNSILDGTGLGDVRPFSTFGTVAGFNFNNNQVGNWGEGAYIVEGGAGSISQNDFHDNGNDIVTESTSMVISANSFENSLGSHIAAVPFAQNVDVSSYILSDNTFSNDHPRPVSIYPNDQANQPVSITGTAFGDTFKGRDNLGDHDDRQRGEGGRRPQHHRGHRERCRRHADLPVAARRQQHHRGDHLDLYSGGGGRDACAAGGDHLARHRRLRHDDHQHCDLGGHRHHAGADRGDDRQRGEGGRRPQHHRRHPQRQRRHADLSVATRWRGHHRRHRLDLYGGGGGRDACAAGGDHLARYRRHRHEHHQHCDLGSHRHHPRALGGDDRERGEGGRCPQHHRGHRERCRRHAELPVAARWRGHHRGDRIDLYGGGGGRDACAAGGDHLARHRRHRHDDHQQCDLGSDRHHAGALGGDDRQRGEGGRCPQHHRGHRERCRRHAELPVAARWRGHQRGDRLDLYGGGGRRDACAAGGDHLARHRRLRHDDHQHCHLGGHRHHSGALGGDDRERGEGGRRPQHHRRRAERQRCHADLSVATRWRGHHRGDRLDLYGGGGGRDACAAGGDHLARHRRLRHRDHQHCHLGGHRHHPGC